MKTPLVAFAPCRDYEGALAPALDTLLSLLGGWAAWVRPGQSVLVKPNLLTDAPPEKAVTTHPALVREVVRVLRRAGARVQVGDSPASAVDLQHVWQATGIADVCREEQVPLLSFEQGGTRTVTRDGHSFAIAVAVLDADLIVNLPKVKSHGLTTFTGAVKNFYGVLPGYQKAQLHRTYLKPDRFCRMLRALHAALPPSFSIADGVIGMEGDGPANGNPVALGFLAASPDAVALDLALCETLRIDPARVPYLSDTAGAIPSHPFVRVGQAPHVDHFSVPSGSAHLLRRIPEPFLRPAASLIWVRPSFNDRCVACGRCVAACPVHALQLAPRERPSLSRRHCIACCCCHEVCPAHAIRMRRSPLLRLLGVFKDLE